MTRHSGIALGLSAMANGANEARLEMKAGEEGRGQSSLTMTIRQRS